MTSTPTDASARVPVDSDDLARMLDEQFPHEDGNVLRGAFFCVLFTLPIWGVIGLVVWGISSLVAG
ncbi:hypothetical protein GCM10009775_00730 [Microbacterium aoyamense]|uniref:Uncharacterized protein n=1 Tax=Microbacterium aoyamense TaxID=344166 RepID=A0ABN2P470_9MICO|nr:hypothetical protein [Microbacterium aoyamense]